MRSQGGTTRHHGLQRLQGRQQHSPQPFALDNNIISSGLSAYLLTGSGPCVAGLLGHELGNIEPAG